MSLNFGYDDKLKTTRLLQYNFTYDSISKSFRIPTYVRSGFPPPYVFGKGINANSRLTLLTHIFDNDDTIVNLKLRYTMRVIDRSGGGTDVSLKDIDMLTKRVGSTNIFLLDETFTIGELLSDPSQIAVFYIKFKQLNDVSLGNESNLDLIIEF